MLQTRAVFIFLLGLLFAGVVLQANVSAGESAAYETQDACRFSEADTAIQSGTVPFTAASTQVIYETQGGIQLAAWGSAGEDVLLTRDLPASNRQSIELLNPETGVVTPLGTRNLTNVPPSLEDGVLESRDWDAGRGVAYQIEAPPCPAVFGDATVLQFQFSPDGRFLAAITTTSRPDMPHGPGHLYNSTKLVLLDFETGTKRNLSPFPQYVTDIAWGPDNWLAVMGMLSADPLRPEVGGLAFVEARTGLVSFSGVEMALGGGVWGTQLLWSADGSQIIASCPTPQHGRLCQIELLRIVIDAIRIPVISTQSHPQTMPSSARSHPYVTPANITIEMYRLTASGARRTPYTYCTPNTDTAFGCTAFCSEAGYSCPLNVVLPYPYASSTITVSVEKDYLLDVVPRELGVYYDRVALQAQAVAARSYALWNWVNGYPTNNSTSYQAFIPRTFEWLWPANYPNDPDKQWDNPCGASYSQLNSGQKLVCDALANPDYISYYANNYEYYTFPARAQFSADAYASTDTGSRPYEIGINDPISTACDANNYGHRWGMSQEGASRWARGHQCSWYNASVYGSNPPGGPWPIKWNRDQILVHYYAGIQVLDKDSNRKTPVYRWNALNLTNKKSWVFQSGGHLFDLHLQNTSAVTWANQAIGVQQVWAGPGGVYTSVVATSLKLDMAADASLAVYLDPGVWPEPGIYTVTLDLARWHAGNGIWQPFATREASRPWYPITFTVEVRAVSDQVFLPLILR